LVRVMDLATAEGIVQIAIGVEAGA
jgi:hypothetical protein